SIVILCRYSGSNMKHFVFLFDRHRDLRHLHSFPTRRSSDLWLSQFGAMGPKWGHGSLDFAGSGVVHAMGGVAAFWGAKILGPRIGKFNKDGSPNAIPGHHLPMAILGTFVLLVGWMGFNGGSTVAGTDLRLTVVIVNTILASAFGCLAAMFVMWRKFGKPDPSMTANGLLAGLVAIT